MTTTTRTAVELLRFPPELPKTAQLFTALRQAAGGADVDVMETQAYRGGTNLLMLWGPGAPNRFEAMRRQVSEGGHVLAWDAAYWSRDSKFRISIDAAHPQQWLMRRDWSRDRFLADRVPVANLWNPKGPILIAGIGRKASAQYGSDVVLAWETAMIAACRARWSRPVHYRRKQSTAPVPAGVSMTGTEPIDQALKGVSLVITWHSNVAVDAIRMGIPVVCRDGAAAAVCPSELPETPEPLPIDLRDRFLGNLAWFQWAPSEADQCWAFVSELFS